MRFKYVPHLRKTAHPWTSRLPSFSPAKAIPLPTNPTFRKVAHKYALVHPGFVRRIRHNRKTRFLSIYKIQKKAWRGPFRGKLEEWERGAVLDRYAEHQRNLTEEWNILTYQHPDTVFKKRNDSRKLSAKDILAQHVRELPLSPTSKIIVPNKDGSLPSGAIPNTVVPVNQLHPHQMLPKLKNIHLRIMLPKKSAKPKKKAKKKGASAENSAALSSPFYTMFFLQLLTSQPPRPVRSEATVSHLKVSAGDLVGFALTLPPNHSFLTKLCEMILPRLKQYQGLSVHSIGRTTAGFSLPPETNFFWPEIQLHKQKFEGTSFQLDVMLEFTDVHPLDLESKVSVLQSIGLPVAR